MQQVRADVAFRAARADQAVVGDADGGDQPLDAGAVPSPASRRQTQVTGAPVPLESASAVRSQVGGGGEVAARVGCEAAREQARRTVGEAHRGRVM